MTSLRFPLFLLALGLPACSGDVTGPPEDSIIGTWQATEIVFLSKTGLGSAEVAVLGWTATLTLEGDHTGVLAMQPAGLPAWQWTGPWEVDGDLFRISGQGADIVLDGGALRLSGFDGVYDFDVDGTPDPAKFNLTLTRI
jgi:hypothetical protein